MGLMLVVFVFSIDWMKFFVDLIFVNIVVVFVVGNFLLVFVFGVIFGVVLVVVLECVEFVIVVFEVLLLGLFKMV